MFDAMEKLSQGVVNVPQHAECALCQRVVGVRQHGVCSGEDSAVLISPRYVKLTEGLNVCATCMRHVDVERHKCKGRDDSRGFCYRCLCGGIKKEGHQERCERRIDYRFDARKALLGDVLHQVDVKLLVAAYEPDVAKLTVVATEYISAVGQREYLERVEPGACEAGRSDHTWATAFEVRYGGTFRADYVTWLKSRLMSGQVNIHVRDYARDELKRHIGLLRLEDYEIEGFIGRILSSPSFVGYAFGMGLFLSIVYALAFFGLPELVWVALAIGGVLQIAYFTWMRYEGVEWF